MKAKMPRGQKIAEEGEYLCQNCEKTFTFKGVQYDIACPNCGNSDPNELVPVYMEDDIEEERMYSDADWGEGD